MSDLTQRLKFLHEQGKTRNIKLWGEPDLAGSSPCPAAVLIAITQRQRPGALMIHRPHTMRAHPGDVAFPGGKIDIGENPIEAAIREANEELGIKREDIEVIAPTDLYLTGSGYEITPIIAVVPASLKIIPNPDEVTSWFEVPLDFVLDRANYTYHAMAWRGRERRYIEIIWQEHRIWGVSAGIIANLAQRIA